jgi:hypothetical protein
MLEPDRCAGLDRSVLALLPVELVLNVGSAMVLALLLSAILWNLGTRHR